MENTVPIVGYVINAYQNKWYVTDTGLYIYENNVTYKEPLKTCTGTNIATGNLAINSQPSAGNQISGGSIPSGATVIVDPTKTASNGWMYVTYNGISGYSSGNLIALTDRNVNTGLTINNNGQSTISMTKGTVPTLPTVSSNVNLSYLKVNVDSQTSTAIRVMTNPGAKSVSLSSYSDLTTGLKGLAVGTHTLWVAAMDVGGSAKSVKYSINITASAPATYTVSYNANGGTGAPAAQTKTAGVTLTLTSTCPTRSGYNFLGWAESSSAAAPTYHSGGSFTKDAKTTLYAVWGKKLELTGGTGTYTLGDTVTISYSAGGVTEYTIEIYSQDDEMVFSQTTTALSVNFKPTEAGHYSFAVAVTIENGLNFTIQYVNGEFSVLEKPQGHSVSTDKSTYLLGETVVITPSAAGADYYAISVWDGGDYGVGTQVYYNGHFTGSVSFTPETAGTYGILCNAFNDAGRVSAKTTFTVVDPTPAPVPPTITGVTANKTAVAAGTPITWTASASGGTGTLQYCFYVFKDGKIAQRGNYGAANTYTYAPGAGGVYTVRVYVKDSKGLTATLDNAAAVTVSAAPPAITGVTASRTTATAGDSVTWTASASGGSGTLQYCFYVFKDGKIAQRGSYGTAKTYTYAPAAAGTYTVRVYVKDAYGTVVTLDNAGTVRVTAPAVPISITGVTPSRTSVTKGDSITWTASATGGTGTLQYCFYVFRDGKIAERGAYGTAKTYTYRTGEAGTYTVRVYVKDGSGTVKTLDNAGKVTATSSDPLTIFGLAPNKSSAGVGDSITWNAAAAGGTGTIQYCFYVFKNGKIAERGSYGTAKSFTYVPSTAGTYTVRVYVKDASGTVVTLDNAGAVTVS